MGLGAVESFMMVLLMVSSAGLLTKDEPKTSLWKDGFIDAMPWRQTQPILFAQKS
jgi:hypothetical protein